MHKTAYIFYLFLLILVSIAYADQYNDPLTKGQADSLYCPQYGGCGGGSFNFSGANVTFINDFDQVLNTTSDVTFNTISATGDISAGGVITGHSFVGQSINLNEPATTATDYSIHGCNGNFDCRLLFMLANQDLLLQYWAHSYVLTEQVTGGTDYIYSNITGDTLYGENGLKIGDTGGDFHVQFLNNNFTWDNSTICTASNGYCSSSIGYIKNNTDAKLLNVNMTKGAAANFTFWNGFTVAWNSAINGVLKFSTIGWNFTNPINALNISSLMIFQSGKRVLTNISVLGDSGSAVSQYGQAFAQNAVLPLTNTCSGTGCSLSSTGVTRYNIHVSQSQCQGNYYDSCSGTATTCDIVNFADPTSCNNQLACTANYGGDCSILPYPDCTAPPYYGCTDLGGSCGGNYYDSCTGTETSCDMANFPTSSQCNAQSGCSANFGGDCTTVSFSGCPGNFEGCSQGTISCQENLTSGIVTQTSCNALQ